MCILYSNIIIQDAFWLDAYYVHESFKQTPDNCVLCAWDFFFIATWGWRGNTDVTEFLPWRLSHIFLSSLFFDSSRRAPLLYTWFRRGKKKINGSFFFLRWMKKKLQLRHASIQIYTWSLRIPGEGALSLFLLYYSRHVNERLPPLPQTRQTIMTTFAGFVERRQTCDSDDDADVPFFFLWSKFFFFFQRRLWIEIEFYRVCNDHIFRLIDKNIDGRRKKKFLFTLYSHLCNLSHAQ